MTNNSIPELYAPHSTTLSKLTISEVNTLQLFSNFGVVPLTGVLKCRVKGFTSSHPTHIDTVFEAGNTRIIFTAIADGWVGRVQDINTSTYRLDVQPLLFAQFFR